VIRLAFRAAPEHAEQVLAAILELAPSGVEQVDGDDFVELAVYGVPGELPSFPEGPAEVGGVRVDVSGREVPDDWGERWKRFHRPVLVRGRIHVRPPWEDAPPERGLLEIVIDPGQAFGTGSHATTEMCLELMLEVDPRGSVADLGCGSGVLAIAAAKLGFAPVAAVDAEQAAIDAAHMNARANGVTLDDVQRVDLRTTRAPKADLVVANLMRPLLLRVAELWAGEPPELVVVSGLLDEEADDVAAAFAPLRERRRLSRQGWAALLLA
jgi:ribosomal protein L11 methyltransferase